jgi:hypothetical protein
MLLDPGISRVNVDMGIACGPDAKKGGLRRPFPEFEAASLRCG